jgi:hypothetical protein
MSSKEKKQVRARIRGKKRVCNEEVEAKVKG